MKRVFVLPLAITLFTLSGCSWLGLTGEDGYFRNRTDDYLDARQTTSMQLPAGVQSKSLDELLVIPGHVATTTATQYEVPRPPRLASTAGIYSDFTLQKREEERWVLARRTPAESWPMVLEFLQMSGFTIAEQSQTKGELITAWQPRQDLAAVLGSGTEDFAEDNADSDIRVRTMVEPGAQKNTTEIFITTAARPKGSDEDDAAWRNDTGQEITLLEGLISSMAANDQEQPEVSLLGERDFDTPTIVRLANNSSGVPVLTLGANFDRAWSSVGRALEEQNILVQDLDRTQGIYYISLATTTEERKEESGFFEWIFGRDETKVAAEKVDQGPERYRLQLVEQGQFVLVTVQDSSGTNAALDIAQPLLGRIQKAILTPSRLPMDNR